MTIVLLNTTRLGSMHCRVCTVCSLISLGKLIQIDSQWQSSSTRVDSHGARAALQQNVEIIQLFNQPYLHGPCDIVTVYFTFATCTTEIKLATTHYINATEIQNHGNNTQQPQGQSTEEVSRHIQLNDSPGSCKDGCDLCTQTVSTAQAYRCGQVAP
eukprot:scpid107432/ scgid20823/ 